MSRHAVIALILCLTVDLAHVAAGPLDAALSWARADKLPIEIDVNLPWLPCKFQKSIHFNYLLLRYGRTNLLNLSKYVQWVHYTCITSHKHVRSKAYYWQGTYNAERKLLGLKQTRRLPSPKHYCILMKRQHSMNESELYIRFGHILLLVVQPA